MADIEIDLTQDVDGANHQINNNDTITFKWDGDFDIENISPPKDTTYGVKIISKSQTGGYWYLQCQINADALSGQWEYIFSFSSVSALNTEARVGDLRHKHHRREAEYGGSSVGSLVLEDTVAPPPPPPPPSNIVTVRCP